MEAAGAEARRPLRLMQVELQSFKSYGPTPTVIRCWSANGLTALIGKNGCGKSAVVDALMWILGESGGAIRTTTTAQLVNRQCAESGAPTRMSAKLCVHSPAATNGAHASSSDREGGLPAAAEFFSIAKEYDGKKSTLRLETYADAAFAGPLSTRHITYAALRVMLQVSSSGML